MSDFWQWFFTFNNFVIVVGYVFVGVAVIPYMEIRPWTKFWGSIFFLTCGLTHLELAFHSYLKEELGFSDGGIAAHMQVVHAVQAFSVLGFVRGLYHEFVIPKAEGQ